MYRIKKVLITLFVVSSLIFINANASTVKIINSSNDYDIGENGDGVYLELILSSSKSTPTQVTLDFNQSNAILGEDFHVLDTQTWESIPSANQQISITIAPNTLSKKLFLQTIVDYTHEGDENILFAIKNTNNNLDFNRTFLRDIFITDDDNLVQHSVRLVNSSGDYNIREDGDAVFMAVVLPSAETTDTVVVLNFSQSIATPDLDFVIRDAQTWEQLEINNSKVSITIPAGETSSKFFIHTKSDDLFEGDEKVILKITDVSDGLSISPSSSAYVTINDNDEEIIEEGVYYVSLNGSDTLNTGSVNSPFKTISYASSKLKPGETLIVLPGHYDEHNIYLTQSGTETEPIVIKAQVKGSVFFKGTRPSGISLENNFGTGFILHDISNVIIDGFNFSDFDTGISINGDAQNNQTGYAKNITIKNTTFKNNASSGIESWKLDKLLVSNCRFISLEPVGGWEADVETVSAIQDYGIAIYHSIGSIVENSYFFGAHNQALSFKYGNHDCIARRNIFAGNLYTALYLGQGAPSEDKPLSTNLIAEYNIIRNASNYHLKNGITAWNVKNAIIRYNYIEGFGISKGGSIGGIQVFDDAKGKIEIYNNIMAFGKKEKNNQIIYSGGIFLDYNINPETKIKIHDNIIYDNFQELLGGFNDDSHTFINNIVGSCSDYYFDILEEPAFINGTPTAQALDEENTTNNFDMYYESLIRAFKL